MQISTKNFIVGVLKNGKFHSCGLINTNNPILKQGNIINAGKVLFGKGVDPSTYTQQQINDIVDALCTPVNIGVYAMVKVPDPTEFWGWKINYQLLPCQMLNIVKMKTIILEEKNEKVCAYDKDKDVFCYGDDTTGAAQLALSENSLYRIENLVTYGSQYCCCIINEVAMIDNNINGKPFTVNFNPAKATAAERNLAVGRRLGYV
jgi:hypothetical protein